MLQHICVKHVAVHGAACTRVARHLVPLLFAHTIMLPLRTRPTLKSLAWHWSHWSGRSFNQGGKWPSVKEAKEATQTAAHGLHGEAHGLRSAARLLVPLLFSHSLGWGARPYRGTSLTRKCTALGTYNRTRPRVLGGGAFSYGRGTPVRAQSAALAVCRRIAASSAGSVHTHHDAPEHALHSEAHGLRSAVQGYFAQKNPPPVGPCSRPMPRDLLRSYGDGC